VNICRELKANDSLASGGLAKDQQDRRFVSPEIRVHYSDFQPKLYRQLGGAFPGGLSVVDALMNCGDSVRSLLRDRSAEDVSKGTKHQEL